MATSSIPDSLLRDQLAIDRTQLANERTLLAYFRTSLALFITGMSGVHLPGIAEQMNLGPGYQIAGWAFIAAAALVAAVGYARFQRIRKRIRQQVAGATAAPTP